MDPIVHDSEHRSGATAWKSCIFASVFSASASALMQATHTGVHRQVAMPYESCSRTHAMHRVLGFLHLPPDSQVGQALQVVWRPPTLGRARPLAMTRRQLRRNSNSQLRRIGSLTWSTQLRRSVFQKAKLHHMLTLRPVVATSQTKQRGDERLLDGAPWQDGV